MVKLPVANSDATYTVNPTKIVALGLNYREHIAESRSVKVQGFTDEIPAGADPFSQDSPTCSSARRNRLSCRDSCMNTISRNLRTDYEAELAIVIKDRCKNVPPGEAMQHILGFTCMNDVSQRNLQTGDRSGWFRGKSLDTFGPIGPRIVRPEDLGDPQNLRIQCRLNGNTVQDSNTRHMIFPIPEIIAFISKNFTLMPGDVIATGTPAGVGAIQPGDVVEVEIEKIGILRNPVVAE